jgi:ABC-type lipoprotein release transport system permease subunit
MKIKKDWDFDKYNLKSKYKDGRLNVSGTNRDGNKGANMRINSGIVWKIIGIIFGIIILIVGDYVINESNKQRENQKEIMIEILDNSEISDTQYKWISNWKEESIKNNFKETLEKINKSLEDNKITNQEFETIRISYAKELKEFEIRILKNK